MVTFCLSCLKTSLSGGGRKSSMISMSPMGSSVYLIFFFINFFTFSPITSTKDSNIIFPVGKSHCHNSLIYSSDTIISFLTGAMSFIRSDDSKWIIECILSFNKRNIMFRKVFAVLIFAPFKALLAHLPSLGDSNIKSNINNHINIHTI